MLNRNMCPCVCLYGLPFAAYWDYYKEIEYEKIQDSVNFCCPGSVNITS